MCAVSMVADDWTRRLPKTHPWVVPSWPATIPDAPSRAEFDKLRRDVEALRKLLIEAKRYDEATGQPDCETDEKMALLRKIAEKVGVDLGTELA